MKKTDFRLLAFIVLLIILPLIKVSANKVVITVQNFTFNPAAVSDVAVGDTIHWDWIDGSHTTTSTTVPAGASTWNSSLNSANPSFEYKVTVAGVYNFKCTPHAAMGMVGTFTASIATGINAGASVFGSLQLSPNPASVTVKISFSPVNSFRGSLKLLNLLGKTIWKSEPEFVAGTNHLELNVSDIPKGLYFIELTDGMNNRAIKRLIVQ
jgi:plastocyanin